MKKTPAASAPSSNPSALNVHARSPTPPAWTQHYIDHRTGIQRDTIAKYRAYLKNDIGPSVGEIPLAVLSRDDIAAWINQMQDDDASGKTVKNKVGLLSAAMKAAVREGKIPGNPCEGVRLPRWDRAEPMFLSEAEFQGLLASVTEFWRPMVQFLVASGCRWGEAVALKPADIDRDANTVRITRAWKYVKGGYYLGPPKTKKSVRTINVHGKALDALDYEGEWVFQNRDGGPVRYAGFHRRVWQPAIKKAQLRENPSPHDLRHTFASWNINGGVPLPTIQRQMGHEDIGTTVNLYGHLDRRTAIAAADTVGAALGWT
jgi:integrase